MVSNLKHNKKIDIDKIIINNDSKYQYEDCKKIFHQCKAGSVDRDLNYDQNIRTWSFFNIETENCSHAHRNESTILEAHPHEYDFFTKNEGFRINACGYLLPKVCNNLLIYIYSYKSINNAYIVYSLRTN